MLVSRVMEWSKLRMPHRCTFRNFTHRPLAIWDLSNHDFFQIIPDAGSQKRVPLLLESICTIPLHGGASDVKMPRLRQHSSNCGIPCFVNAFGTFWGTWDQSNENPRTLYIFAADMFSNITNREIQRPRMLVAQNIDQVCFVRCTYDWHNHCSGQKLILSIPPPMSSVHLAVDATTLGVSEVHQFKIVVRLQWAMCQKEQDTFGNIPVL